MKYLNDIKFKKTGDICTTKYLIMKGNNIKGSVTKKLSGGFSFYWEAKINNNIGTGKTRKSAVQNALQ